MPSAGSDVYWAPIDSEQPAARLDYDFRKPSLERIRRFRSTPTTVALRDHIVGLPQYGLAQQGAASGDIAFVNIQHLARSGRIAFSGESFLSSVDDGHRLELGEIVVARTGFTLGKAGLVEEEQVGYAFGSFCLRLHLLPHDEGSGYLPEFVTAFLNSPLGREQFDLLQTGSDKKNVNQEQLADLRVPALSPSDQRALLDSLEPTRQGALAAEGTASELMASVLEDFERGLVDAEIHRRSYAHRSSARPTSYFWVTDGIGRGDERLDFEHLTPENAHDVDLLGEVRRLSRLGAGALAIRTGDGLQLEADSATLGVKAAAVQMGYLSERALVAVRPPSDECQILRSGDLLIVNIGHGSLGNVAMYEAEHLVVTPGPEVTVVRMQDGYDPAFVTFYLMSRFGQSQFCKWFSGSSGQIHIYEGQLAAFMIPDADPAGVPLEEQRSLAEAATEKHKRAMEAKKGADAKWDSYYDTLSDRILTG